MGEHIRFWTTCARAAWRHRRTEAGGLTDDVAMMAILVAVAVAVGGALLAILLGAVESLDFSVPGT
jgi:hypothetical protein